MAEMSVYKEMQEIYERKKDEWRNFCAEGITFVNRKSSKREHLGEVKEPAVIEVMEEKPVFPAPPSLKISDFISIKDKLKPVSIEGLECEGISGWINGDIEGDYLDRPKSDSLAWCKYRLYGMENKKLWAGNNPKAKDGFEILRTTRNSVLLHGVHVGVRYTPVGCESCLLIPPNFLYGDLGGPPLIPPKAWGILFIRVESYIDVSFAKRYNLMDAASQKSFELVKPFIEECRSAAKQFFARELYNEAVDAYEFSIKMITNCFPDTEEMPIVASTLLAKMYVNVAMCSEKLKKYRNFVKALDKALVFKGRGANLCKIYFWKGRYLVDIGKHEEGFQVLLEALKIDPNNEELGKELIKADEIVTQNKLKSKEASKKAMGVKCEENVQDNELSTTLSEDQVKEAYGAIVDIIRASNRDSTLILPGESHMKRDADNLRYLIDMWNKDSKQQKYEVIHENWMLRLEPKNVSRNSWTGYD